MSTVVVAAMRCLAVLAVLVELLAAAGVTTAAGPSRDLLQTTRQFPQLTGSWPRLEISLLDKAPVTDRYRVSEGTGVGWLTVGPQAAGSVPSPSQESKQPSFQQRCCAFLSQLPVLCPAAVVFALHLSCLPRHDCNICGCCRACSSCRCGSCSGVPQAAPFHGSA